MRTPSLLTASGLIALVCAPLPTRAQSAAKPRSSDRSPLQELTRALAGKWQLDVRFEPDSSARNKVIEGSAEESWSAGPGVS
jgi:hypothetical protein